MFHEDSYVKRSGQAWKLRLFLFLLPVGLLLFVIPLNPSTRPSDNIAGGIRHRRSGHFDVKRSVANVRD